MRPFWRLLACALFISANLNCSVNVLSTFSNQQTDEAYYYDALKLMNEGDYNGALAKVALMSSAYAAEHKVITLKASAYGGICGINFLQFAQAMTAMTTRFFPFLADQFKGATSAKIDACKTAETLMQSLGTAAVRSNDENMFLAVVSMAKLGTLLSYYLDANQDGTTDVDPCTFTPRGARPGAVGAGDWTDADLRQVGTGITIAVSSLSALTGSVNLGGAAISTISTTCATMGGANFCSITDPTAFDATQLLGIRTLLNESTAVGLGATCTGDVTACLCP